MPKFKRYRVLIRAFTYRRDVAPMLLLQKVLERLDCEVIIACSRNFEFSLKLWKPHVTVVNTLGLSVQIKHHCPFTKVVYFDGEGFQAPGFSNAEYWASNPMAFDFLDLVLVWGKQGIKECQEYASNLDCSKLHVVGNPKLDLVRYLPDRFKANGKAPSVGVVCRFPNLNDYEGRMPVRTLANPGNLEKIFVQMKGFVAVVEVVRVILSRTHFQISIRPHPSEQVESYKSYISNWFGKGSVGRVTVDESMDFPAWASGQQALLSPSSTSFLEAYLLGVPIINLDAIADAVEHNRDYAPVIGEWQTASLMPKSTGELCQMLLGGLSFPSKNSVIESQLADYCDWYSNTSSCLRAAILIKQLLDGTDFSPIFHWPTFIVELRDAVSFKRAMRRNPLHHNFNYQPRFHETPSHYDEMADRILAESTRNRSI